MLNEIDDSSWLEPPDYEANAVLKCYWCEKGFFEDEEYYEINGKAYREDCWRITSRNTLTEKNWRNESWIIKKKIQKKFAAYQKKIKLLFLCVKLANT